MPAFHIAVLGLDEIDIQFTLFDPGVRVFSRGAVGVVLVDEQLVLILPGPAGRIS